MVFEYQWDNSEANFGPPIKKEMDGGTHITFEIILKKDNKYIALRRQSIPGHEPPPKIKENPQVIFFGLLFGFCITIAPDIHRDRMKSFFDSAFEIMMRMAGLVLKLIPYGVFCLLVKTVGETGFGLFKPLAI